MTLACDHPEAYRSAERYLRYLAPGLAHLGPLPFGIVVHVVSAADIPHCPADATPLVPRDRYELGRLGHELIYRRSGYACVRVEPQAGTASVWTPASDPASISALISIALLEIASSRGFFGLHAGAVAVHDIGYLLPGPSGSGKSSVCLTLMRAGFRYLTDDFVLLKGDQHGVRCVPFFRTFNVDTAWAEQFPELSFLRDRPALPQGKRMFDPEWCYPGSHIESARPGVLVFPTIVPDTASTLRPLSRHEAFCRLLPQSRLSADAGLAANHLETLATLVRGTAAWELRHGQDFMRAPVATLRRLFAPVGDAPGYDCAP